MREYTTLRVRTERLNYRMNSKYWSDEQTSELIQLIEKNQCLWNVNHIYYRDRTKRQLALTKMAIKLKHSAKQIRTKIKNLRSQYQTIRKLMKKGQKVADWKFYSDLHFMFEHIDTANGHYDDRMDTKVNVSSKRNDTYYIDIHIYKIIYIYYICNTTTY